MLLFTAMFGGLLLMMGNHSPSDHLLRLIDRHVNFDFVRVKFAQACAVHLSSILSVIESGC